MTDPRRVARATRAAHVNAGDDDRHGHPCRAAPGLEGPGRARFEDGPARGIEFASVRLPWFVRSVQKMGMPPTREAFDVLDQLDDEPRLGEQVHVYRQRVWAHGRGTGYEARYVEVPWELVARIIGRSYAGAYDSVYGADWPEVADRLAEHDGWPPFGGEVGPWPPWGDGGAPEVFACRR